MKLYCRNNNYYVSMHTSDVHTLYMYVHNCKKAYRKQEACEANGKGLLLYTTYSMYVTKLFMEALSQM